MTSMSLEVLSLVISTLTISELSLLFFSLSTMAASSWASVFPRCCSVVRVTSLHTMLSRLSITGSGYGLITSTALLVLVPGDASSGACSDSGEMISILDTD